MMDATCTTQVIGHIDLSPVLFLHATLRKSLNSRAFFFLLFVNDSRVLLTRVNRIDQKSPFSGIKAAIFSTILRRQQSRPFHFNC